MRGQVNLIKNVSFGSNTTTTATQSQIKKLSSIEYMSVYGLLSDWSLDINNLPLTLTTLNLSGSDKSYGTVSATTVFPPNLISLGINGTNTIRGDIRWFFGTHTSITMPNLTALSIQGLNTLSGDIINIVRADFNSPTWYLELPATTLTILTIWGNNTITGDISILQFLPLTNIYITGLNTLSGEIRYINFINYIAIGGRNTITGDLYGLSHGDTSNNTIAMITYINITGYNTIYGDIANLPSSLTYINLGGYNIVSGDIANLPSSLTSISIYGHNTISGDLSNIPCTYAANFQIDAPSNSSASSPVVGYGNTITGDLADLALFSGAMGSLTSTLQSFIVGGHNTITGDIANLAAFNSGSLSTFVVYGHNSIYGDIGNIPNRINRFSLTNSSGYIYGDLSNNALQYFYINGTNSITGDLANLYVQTIEFTIMKNITKLSYTGRTNWPYKLSRLYLQPNIGAGLTTTEVDNLLIDLANGGAANGAVIYLAGHNSPHSALSNVAIGTLISKGCSVTYNI
jgi:hypothetical protein